MPNRGDKELPAEGEGAMGEGATGSARDARQATWDQSWERAETGG